MEILIPLEGPSITGLQAKDLMGLTVNSINELSDSDSQSFKTFYEELYQRSVRRLEMDVQKMLSGIYRFPDGQALLGRFNFNAKFQTVLTSEYVAGEGSDNPAIQVQSFLSLYSALCINFVEINVLETSPNPQDIIVRIDELNTGLFLELPFKQTLALGTNRFSLSLTLPIRWLNIKISVNIVSSPSLIKLSNTQQLLTGYSSFTGKGWCRCQCGSSGYLSTYQLAPGLNVSMTGICSIARFIELNIPLFKYALLYAIGVEFMKDRIATDRINQYTALTIDRSNQLLALYEKDYMLALDTLRDIRSIPEDFDCFECKRSLNTNNLLP